MHVEELGLFYCFGSCLFFVFFKQLRERGQRPGEEVKGHLEQVQDSGSLLARLLPETSETATTSLLRCASSEAEAVVRKRVRTVGSVSVTAVPAGVGQPVQVHQPRVQDLGVSTGHCETGGDTEEVD